MTRPGWVEIIEAAPMRLRDLILEGTLSKDQEAYGQVLLASREGDVETLQHWIQARLTRSELPGREFLWLARARHSLRTHAPEPAGYREWLQAQSSPLLLAEGHFVLGQILEAGGAFAEAERSFNLSHSSYKEMGAGEKAAAASLNSLTLQERRGLRWDILRGYLQITRNSGGSKEIAASAHLNLSRALQRFGACELARTHAEQAVQKMGEEGSLNFARALAHQAHVLLHLDRKAEFERTCEKLQHFEFPESRASNQVLELWSRGEKIPDALYEKCSVTWKRRIEFERTAGALISPWSVMENQILEVLLEGPSSVDSLAKRLHGDRIDRDSVRKRVYKALERLSNKLSGQIASKDGTYILQDTSA